MILEEHGLFWWVDEPIAESRLAPEHHVAGVLKVDNQGRSALGPMAALADREVPANKCIRGLLKGSNRHILLVELTRSPHFNTNGICFEHYVASTCFVSERKPLPPQLTFEQLIVPVTTC
jgi:hypothetical protein